MPQLNINVDTCKEGAVVATCADTGARAHVRQLALRALFKNLRCISKNKRKNNMNVIFIQEGMI